MLRLNVGLSKKIGQPDYGSLGASCHVEVELDHGLLTNDLDQFHQRVEHAFVACRQAVNDELVRQQEPTPVLATNRAGRIAGRAESDSKNGSRRNRHTASDKQLGYARQLAGQVDGLGVRGLDSLADKMFGKPVATLTTLDASGLIDTLKAIKNGEIELAAALDGATA